MLPLISLIRVAYQILSETSWNPCDFDLLTIFIVLHGSLLFFVKTIIESVFLQWLWSICLALFVLFTMKTSFSRCLLVLNLSIVPWVCFLLGRLNLLLHLVWWNDVVIRVASSCLRCCRWLPIDLTVRSSTVLLSQIIGLMTVGLVEAFEKVVKSTHWLISLDLLAVISVLILHNVVRSQ